MMMPDATPMPAPTLLIHLNDVEEQPAVLRGLCDKILMLPHLAEGMHPLLFVAEGADYNAVAWQLHIFQKKFPQRNIRLMQPWELTQWLEAIQEGNAEALEAQVIAVAVSQKSEALLKAIEGYIEAVPPTVNGYLLQNENTPAPQAIAPFFQTLAVEAGPQQGELSTKLFSATAYFIHALFFPNETLVQMDIISIGLATLLQSLPFHPEWARASELMSAHTQRPIQLVACDAMLPLMPEFQRLLTQSLGVMVQYTHVANYPHEANHYANPDQAEQWPLHIYFPPEKLAERQRFDAAVHSHLKTLNEESRPHAVQLWINANTEMDAEAGENTPINSLNADKVAELSMFSFIPPDLIVLAIVQRMAHDVLARRHPERVGSGVDFGTEQEEILIGETTVRTGTCNGCGQCCQNISLRVDKKNIMTLEDYEAIVAKNPEEYGRFKPIAVSKAGVLFKCSKLGDDNLCTDYENRPALCRSYPTEDSVTKGAKLPADCSYEFFPVEEFNKIMEARAQQGQKLPEFIIGLNSMQGGQPGEPSISSAIIPLEE